VGRKQQPFYSTRFDYRVDYLAIIFTSQSKQAAAVKKLACSSWCSKEKLLAKLMKSQSVIIAQDTKKLKAFNAAAGCCSCLQVFHKNIKPVMHIKSLTYTLRFLPSNSFHFFGEILRVGFALLACLLAGIK